MPGKGGELLGSDMPERLWGIKARRLNLVADAAGLLYKKPLGKGGWYDCNMGAEAAKQAICQAAQREGMTEVELTDKIRVVIEASATLPIGVGDHQGHYIKELGLNNPDFDSKMVGCGGMLTALNSARRALSAGEDYVLVVFSNCPSQHFATLKDRQGYGGEMGNKACALMFSDGATAFVLGRTEKDQGFIEWTHNVDLGTEYTLIEVPNNVYYMHVDNVGNTFVPTMMKNYESARTIFKDRFGVDDPAEKIARLVSHQASLPGVIETVWRTGLICKIDRDLSVRLSTYYTLDKRERRQQMSFILEAAEKIRRVVPTMMQSFGNPAVASSATILHRALNDGVGPDSTLLGMVIGAGRGGTEYGVFVYQT
ncbi:MAG: hypothetical protein HOC36_02020 [Candidatus Magasanikbacteria bacterium]|nr:hypothetical protein [Candidatus Magasanikbacteria bacterium]